MKRIVLIIIEKYFFCFISFVGIGFFLVVVGVYLIIILIFINVKNIISVLLIWKCNINRGSIIKSVMFFI